MNTAEIKRYLGALNDELRAIDVKGEICLDGGAVMCLVKAIPIVESPLRFRIRKIFVLENFLSRV